MFLWLCQFGMANRFTEKAQETVLSRGVLDGLSEQADPGRVFGLYLPREETCVTVKTLPAAPASSEMNPRNVAPGLFWHPTSMDTIWTHGPSSDTGP